MLEAVLVVALLGGGAAALIAFLRWHSRRTERFWRAAAERLGGELTFEAGWFGDTCSLTVTLYDRSVTVAPGRGQQVIARASTTHPAGFELRVQPRPPGFLVDRARAVATGDPVFDAVFNVEATHPELALGLFDDALRERISRAGAVFLHVSDGSVVGSRAVFGFEEDGIDRLTQAVAAMAAKSIA